MRQTVLCLVEQFFTDLFGVVTVTCVFWVHPIDVFVVESPTRPVVDAERVAYSHFDGIFECLMELLFSDNEFAVADVLDVVHGSVVFLCEMMSF